MRYPDGACILSAHIKTLKHRKIQGKKIKAEYYFFYNSYLGILLEGD